MCDDFNKTLCDLHIMEILFSMLGFILLPQCGLFGLGFCYIVLYYFYFMLILANPNNNDTSIS